MNALEQIEQAERTYRTLQRRTLLYGVVSWGLCMLVSIILVRVLALSALQGLAFGCFIGVFSQLLSAALARKLTPYA